MARMNTLIPNTTPQEQFASDVLPPYEFYMTDVDTEWKARCTANAIAHFGEHVFEYYNYHDKSQLHGATSAERFIYFLADNHQRRELAYIWEFALLGKHRFVTTPAPGGRPRYLGGTVTDATTSQIAISSTGSVLIDSSDLTATGIATEQHGRLLFSVINRPVDEVITLAVRFWENYLKTAPTYK